jgi:hypothetical protein
MIRRTFPVFSDHCEEAQQTTDESQRRREDGSYRLGGRGGGRCSEGCLGKRTGSNKTLFAHVWGQTLSWYKFMRNKIKAE